MHPIQSKILKLSESHNLAGLTLRKIGELIGIPDSPQKIKHHLNKLMEKGLLVMSIDGKQINKLPGGVDKRTNLVALPIYGSANCGQALELADDYIEGYLKVSKKILGEKLASQAKNLFILKAVGNSMNKALVKGESIEDGDYVIVDKSQRHPKSGDCVVSLIDGAANIKKIYFNKQNKIITLMSESTQELPPIYIHEDDRTDYLVSGQVVGVMKRPDYLHDLQKAATKDTLNDLGDMPVKEHDYYMNL